MELIAVIRENNIYETPTGTPRDPTEPQAGNSAETCRQQRDYAGTRCEPFDLKREQPRMNGNTKHFARVTLNPLKLRNCHFGQVLRYCHTI